MRLLPLSSVLFLMPTMAWSAPVPLTSAEQVKTLCRDLAGLDPGDSPLQAARGEAQAAAQRDAARQAQFAVTLPPGAFRLSDADPRSGTLTLDTERAFRLFKGQVVLYPVTDDDLDLTVPRGQPLPASTQGLSLQLVIQAADTDAPCTASLSKEYALGVTVRSARLVDPNGAAVAALTADADDRAGTTTGAPEVTIEPAVVEGAPRLAKALTQRLQAMRPELTACYQQGLKAQPALDGSLVLGFSLQGGKPGAITVVADSVQSDAVSRCVSAAVAGLSLERSPKPSHASVALQFGRK